MDEATIISPELKPHFTAIPNIILDELLPQLSGPEEKVIRVICRQTYGWRKKVDRISNSQMKDKTGLTEKTMKRALSSLVDKQIIQRHPGSGRNITEYSIEYDVTLWKGVKVREGVKMTPQGGQNGAPRGDKNDPPEGANMTPTKDNSQKKPKETPTKEKEPSSNPFDSKTLTLKAIDNIRPTYENKKRILEEWYELQDKRIAEGTALALEKVRAMRSKDEVFDAFYLVGKTVGQLDKRMFTLIKNMLIDYNNKARTNLAKIVEAGFDPVEYTKWFLGKNLKFKGFNWGFFCADSFLLEYDGVLNEGKGPGTTSLSKEERLKKMREQSK